MRDKCEPPLSRRERQIMDIVYARGEATALEVTAAMRDAPGKTAVRTLLRILEEKGHLTHRQDGQTYVYRANQSKERAGQSAFRRVLEVFFGGSLEQAVAMHLGDETADLSKYELARLADLIQKARKRGK